MTDTTICPWCKEGHIKFVHGYEPWSTDHYACELCNSTYNLWEYEQSKKHDGELDRLKESSK
jgi:transposase-like protein